MRELGWVTKTRNGAQLARNTKGTIEDGRKARGKNALWRQGDDPDKRCGTGEEIPEDMR